MKEEVGSSLNCRLWHACAGGMVQMPLLNSKVFYFPQGHAEHALATVDFGNLPRIPPFMLCRVDDVKFLADPETDEVYAKLSLSPISHIDDNQNFVEDEGEGLGSVNNNAFEAPDKPASFAKTLTQSDANNGGGFSVPRYCAETIFPPLDYTADPPVQILVAKDVHGEIWKFRHIYRGTPRRHLLTTGWSTFVNHKKLVAGDSIVFMRVENGDLCVGIRRANRRITENFASSHGGFSASMRECGNKMISSGSFMNRGKVQAESVIKAVSLAASGQRFEVSYYPRASTPEFWVKPSSLRRAMGIQWCSGMRFKMAFETEDSSRISWFVGTITSVQVADPYRWPNSPWRLLQVKWDEPDLLQSVSRVNPWLVELVSNMPIFHLSPFSPPKKKLRLPQLQNFSPDGHLSGKTFTPSNPFSYLPNNIPAGIQGARHTLFGIPFPNIHLTGDLHSELLSPTFQSHDSSRGSIYDDGITENTKGGSNKMGNSSSYEKSDKVDEKVKEPVFLLFGQPILTEQQISDGCSVHEDSKVHIKTSEENLEGFFSNRDFQTSDIGLHTSLCKVFLESVDVGRTLDLSSIESFEALYRTLENLFGVERFNSSTSVIYKDSKGAFKRTGDEPFSEFRKTAKRLTILLEPCSDNVGRKWIMGLRTMEHGLDASNQAGPMTLFA